ncbi:MAG: helix-turn-helix transcriptional regulator [Oscillospiraceae bacterium]|nr:helix-turn-helix transcriptional regulator [Oscillospiraceae bacterium]
MDKAQFGAFVAQNRKELGWTQKELAEKLHVTDKAVSKWERGLSYPDVTLLEPLAGAFDMGVTELVSCRRGEISPAPAEWADWEMPPEEEHPEEAAVQALLDISGESLHTERKRGRRRTFLLAALAVLLAALAVLIVLRAASHTTESDQIRVLHTEGTEGDLTLFTEKEGHLLRLRCAPEIDPAILLELVSFGDPIFAEYRYDRRSWTGTLLSFRQVTSGMAIGGPMDEVGSVFALFDGDGELFGVSRVVLNILSRQPNPYGKGYLTTYQFFEEDENGDWRDREFFRLRNCLDKIGSGGGFRILDYDGDGVNELLARTVWPEKPCIVYDLENGILTETWLDELPEEMTKPAE